MTSAESHLVYPSPRGDAAPPSGDSFEVLYVAFLQHTLTPACPMRGNRAVYADTTLIVAIAYFVQPDSTSVLEPLVNEA